MKLDEMFQSLNRDYQLVLFSDSGGDLHYIDDITNTKQIKKAIEVFKHFKEVEQIDVWIDVRYNPITNKERK
tara:strand:+ start:8109 stop:8324 length:216 start_codon:yes stop_codon:yes gene_type:complete